MRVIFIKSPSKFDPSLKEKVEQIIRETIGKEIVVELDYNEKTSTIFLLVPLERIGPFVSSIHKIQQKLKQIGFELFD